MPERVHNHQPYSPMCNERNVNGQLRGACLNDDGTDNLLVAALREHRADGWACTCGWPLNDSVGSVVNHLAEQIKPLMRCPVADPTGLPCRLFPGHGDEHGDGRGVVWATPKEATR